MSDTLNKTDSRVTALTEVMAKRVMYNPRLSEYLVEDEDGSRESARGARRRTYAELRTAGIVESTSLTEPSLVRLTNLGETIADEWGID